MERASLLWELCLVRDGCSRAANAEQRCVRWVPPGRPPPVQEGVSGNRWPADPPPGGLGEYRVLGSCLVLSLVLVAWPLCAAAGGVRVLPGQRMAGFGGEVSGFLVIPSAEALSLSCLSFPVPLPADPGTAPFLRAPVRAHPSAEPCRASVPPFSCRSLCLL